MKSLLKKEIYKITISFVMAVSLLMIPSVSVAKQFTRNEVEKAILFWVRYVTADNQPNAEIQEVEPYYYNGNIVGYIVQLKGEGFCLCGSNDRAEPVYLYNPKGVYRKDTAAYQEMLTQIVNENIFIRKYDKIKDSIAVSDKEKTELTFKKRIKQWQQLLVGDTTIYKTNLKSTNDVDEMQIRFTPKWHQRAPYNNLTPSLPYGSNNVHTVVGCVATALSQILYYWKWPNQIEGDFETVYKRKYRDSWIGVNLNHDPKIPSDYFWKDNLKWKMSINRLKIRGYWDSSIYEDALNIDTTENKQKYKDALKELYEYLDDKDTPYSISGNSIIYDWDDMKDECNLTDNKCISSVANLCYGVGVAVKMDYGVKGSAAYSSSVPELLWKHFDYDWDVHKIDGDSDDVKKDIIDEIKWLRPVLFSGHRKKTNKISGSDDTGSGHAMVIYGYKKSTDQFLINMGWGGASSYVWATLSNVEFKLEQSFIVAIAPTVVKFVGQGFFINDGSPNNPYTNLKDALERSVTGQTIILKAGYRYTINEKIEKDGGGIIIKGQHVVIRSD